MVEPWIDGLWDSLKGVLSNSDSIENGSVQISAGTDTTYSSQTTTQRVIIDSGDVDVHDGEIRATDSLQKVQSERIVTRAEQGRLTVTESVERTSTEERIVGDLADSVQDQLTIASTLTKTQSTESPDSNATRASAISSGLLQSDKPKTVTDGSSLNVVTLSSSRENYSSKEDTPSLITCMTQATKLPNGEISQGSSQVMEAPTQMTTASSLEITAVTSSSSGRGDGNSGSLKRRGSFKGDASWREELRTPSVELASTLLTLPTIPPLFVKVLMKTVSSLLGCMYIYMACLALQREYFRGFNFSDFCGYCLPSLYFSVLYRHLQT